VISRITILSNTVNGTPPKSSEYSITPAEDQDGIFVGGGNNARNATLSEILVEGNITKNNRQDGIRITRGDSSNEVLLSGITNNIATDNSRDGILITSTVPINAVVGNTNDGRNTGRLNGACNQPSFCFNTPLP
jgi:hypothetical protein